MKTVPTQYDEVTRFQVAASEWAFDRIREAGGLSVLRISDFFALNADGPGIGIKNSKNFCCS